MDRLEKEWFDLVRCSLIFMKEKLMAEQTKNIPKPDMALPSEDSHCAICDDAEGENSNAIVFCDGCNLAVHQDCYGVPYIPEGQWLCRKCTVSPENTVVSHQNYPQPKFLFNDYGSPAYFVQMKAALSSKRSTEIGCTSCVLFGFQRQGLRTMSLWNLLRGWIKSISSVGSWCVVAYIILEHMLTSLKLKKCSICGIRQGACIQCSKSSCFLAFHTTCARREKLLMPMKSAHGSEPATLACYCEKHLPVRRSAHSFSLFD